MSRGNVFKIAVGAAVVLLLLGGVFWYGVTVEDPDLPGASEEEKAEEKDPEKEDEKEVEEKEPEKKEETIKDTEHQVEVPEGAVGLEEAFDTEEEIMEARSEMNVAPMERLFKVEGDLIRTEPNVYQPEHYEFLEDFVSTRFATEEACAAIRLGHNPEYVEPDKELETAEDGNEFDHSRVNPGAVGGGVFAQSFAMEDGSFQLTGQKCMEEGQIMSGDPLELASYMVADSVYRRLYYEETGNMGRVTRDMDEEEREALNVRETVQSDEEHTRIELDMEAYEPMVFLVERSPDSEGAYHMEILE